MIRKYKRPVVVTLCIALCGCFLLCLFQIESNRPHHALDQEGDSPIYSEVAPSVGSREGTHTDTLAVTEGSSAQHSSVSSLERDDVVHTAELKNWPNGSFCEDFLENTFSLKMPICTDGSDRIVCYGTRHDPSMSTCTLRGVALVPKSAFYLDEFESIWLQRETLEEAHQCDSLSYTEFDRHVDRGDYLERASKNAGSTAPKGKCEVTIPGTSFVYIGFASHIFFKFVVWYNLFKSMKENNAPGDAFVIRLSKGKTPFTFPEMEQQLFPGLTPVEHIHNPTSIHCFEKLVLVPWTYTSALFQCKNKAYLRDSCYRCNGTGLEGTAIAHFRRKVLSACSLSDPTSPAHVPQTPKKIVLVLRRPYHRFLGDDPQRFTRIITNSDALVEGLKQEFPNTNVTAVQMEELSLCEQIKLAHETDVLMGVHGAGLVHLWWLQNHALMFELLPQAQTTNPTFRMLSTLTGRRYHEHLIPDSYSDATVTIDVTKVIEEMKELYPQIE